jgi:xylulokinase
MASMKAGAELALPPPIARTIEPDRDLTQAFAEAQLRYRSAYHALKETL